MSALCLSIVFVNCAHTVSSGIVAVSELGAGAMSLSKALILGESTMMVVVMPLVIQVVLAVCSVSAMVLAA